MQRYVTSKRSLTHRKINLQEQVPEIWSKLRLHVYTQTQLVHAIVSI